jgi:capsular exopolysaccharide synthesis family protein
MNTKPIQSKQQDPTEMIKKYLDLLWSNKLWIILITLVVSILWFFISPMVMKLPEYTTSVVIKFDDPRYMGDVSAVTDFAKERTEGKVALLLTNSLLEQIVDTLQLNLKIITKGISRFTLLKHIEIKENAKYGNYNVKYDKNLSLVNVYYTNKLNEIENEHILSVNYDPDSLIHIDINGINLLLNQKLVNLKNDIAITYIPKRFVVEELKQKIKTRLDRSKTVLTVIYSNKDPELAAAVINSLSDIYVKQLLDYKKYRTTSILKSLEDQLEVARNELNLSETSLRQFRERNPFLMLSREGSDIVTQLSDKQNDLIKINQTIERINYLIKNKNNISGINNNAAYQEILSSISSRDIPGSQVMLQQFTSLIDEKNRLVNEKYSEDHMLVQEVNSKINNMQREIDTRVSQFIYQLESQRNNLQKDVSSDEYNIRRLPKNELRLAELERDRQIKSDIYSSILIRYNEAKVADASIISDAFVVEKAEIPLAFGSSIINKLVKLAVGPILGIIFGIALFVILDFLDKSVKESNEVEFKLNIPVLGLIPVIIDDKEIPDEIGKHKQPDYKLITSSYAPNIANEKFRLLRTKLLMKEKEKHTYILTSLTSGDGKSLVAANLAITFAQQKISTLLLDCDLRRGVLHNTFCCNKKKGIADILIRNTAINQSEISQIIQNTHIPNLFLISCGVQVPNPSELLGNLRMQKFLDLIQEKFSVVIIDTPPLEFIADALVLNSLIHKMLLVLRYGKTNLNKANNKILEYSEVKEDIKGLIINASLEADKEKYQSYSYYHY